MVCLPVLISLFLGVQTGLATPAQGSNALERRDAELVMPPLAREFNFKIFDTIDPSSNLTNTTGSGVDTSACQNLCTGFSNNVQGCNRQVSCVCTQKVVDSMDSCFDCILSLQTPTNTTVQNAMQQLQDEIVKDCGQDGYSVSGHTIVPSANGLPSGSMSLKAGMFGVVLALSFVSLTL